MRIRRLAFVGLVVGAFMAAASPAAVDASAVAHSQSSSSSSSTSSSSSSSSLDSLFSSDAPESLHEAKNQGTRDEPKAWPEANAWLHAQLSDAERDFLAMNIALSATGTTSAPATTAPPTAAPSSAPLTCDTTVGLTAAQLSNTQATVMVMVRFQFSQATSTFLSTFQTAVVASIPSSSAASVSAASGSPTVVGSNLYSFIMFTFSPNGATAAGTQAQAFITQFNSGSSALRINSAFALADLTYCPTLQFSVPSTGPPTTLPPTTPTLVATTSPAATQAPPYCTTHTTACLNGGTCINGATATTYSCQCSSGYIGTICQFSLFGANRRSGSGSTLARGKSVTRPNAAVKPKSA